VPRYGATPSRLAGDTPNTHDTLTGSKADGRAFTDADGMTCRNRTSSESGAAMVGHHDRMGLRDDEPSKSWNTSHPSRGPNGGCSQEARAAPAAPGCHSPVLGSLFWGRIPLPHRARGAWTPAAISISASSIRSPAMRSQGVLSRDARIDRSRSLAIGLAPGRPRSL
jgi:hypothetical protein